MDKLIGKHLKRKVFPKKEKITKDTITVPFKTKFVESNISPRLSNWLTTIIVLSQAVFALLFIAICIRWGKNELDILTHIRKLFLFICLY